jgi:hypothetical protein
VSKGRNCRITKPQIISVKRSQTANIWEVYEYQYTYTSLLNLKGEIIRSCIVPWIFMTFLGGVVVRWTFRREREDGIKIPNERIYFSVGRSHRCVITRGYVPFLAYVTDYVSFNVVFIFSCPRFKGKVTKTSIKLRWCNKSSTRIITSCLLHGWVTAEENGEILRRNVTHSSFVQNCLLFTDAMDLIRMIL